MLRLPLALVVLSLAHCSSASDPSPAERLEESVRPTPPAIAAAPSIPFDDVPWTRTYNNDTWLVANLAEVERTTSASYGVELDGRPVVIRVGDEGWEEAFSQVRGPVRIELRGRTTDGPVFERIAALSRVHAVMLQTFRFDAEQMERVAQLPRLFGLSTIESQYSPNIIRSLGSDLRILELLYGSPATEAHFEAIVEHTKLQVLTLFQEGVTESGVAHLSRLTQLKQLRILDGSALTDASLRRFYELPALTVLEASGTWSDEVVEAAPERIRFSR